MARTFVQNLYSLILIGKIGENRVYPSLYAINLQPHKIIFFKNISKENHIYFFARDDISSRKRHLRIEIQMDINLTFDLYIILLHINP